MDARGGESISLTSVLLSGTSNEAFVRTLKETALSYFSVDCHVPIPTTAAGGENDHDHQQQTARPEVIKIITNWKIKHKPAAADGSSSCSPSYVHVDDVYPANFAQYLRWAKFEQLQLDPFGDRRGGQGVNSTSEGLGGESGDGEGGNNANVNVFSVDRDVKADQFGGSSSSSNSSASSFAAATIANIVLAHVEDLSCDKTTTISGGGTGRSTKAASSSASPSTFRYSYSSTRSDPSMAYNYNRGAANDSYGRVLFSNASVTGGGCAAYITSGKFHQAFPMDSSAQHAVGVLGLDLFSSLSDVCGRMFGTNGCHNSGISSVSVPLASASPTHGHGSGGSQLSSSVVEVWKDKCPTSIIVSSPPAGGNGRVETLQYHSRLPTPRSSFYSSSATAKGSTRTNPAFVLSAARQFRERNDASLRILKLVEDLWNVLDRPVYSGSPTLLDTLMTSSSSSSSAGKGGGGGGGAAAVAPLCSNPWLLFAPNSSASNEANSGTNPPSTRFSQSELRDGLLQWLGLEKRGAGQSTSTSTANAHDDGARAALEAVLAMVTTPLCCSADINSAPQSTLNFEFLEHCFLPALRGPADTIADDAYPAIRSGGSANPFVRNAVDGPCYLHSSGAGLGLFPYLHLIQRQLTASVTNNGGTAVNASDDSVSGLPSSVSILNTNHVLREVGLLSPSPSSPYVDANVVRSATPDNIKNTTPPPPPCPLLLSGPPLLHMLKGAAAGALKQFYVPRRLREVMARQRIHKSKSTCSRKGDGSNRNGDDNAKGDRKSSPASTSPSSSPSYSSWLNVSSVMLLKTWGLPTSAGAGGGGSGEAVLDVLSAHHLHNNNSSSGGGGGGGAQGQQQRMAPVVDVILVAGPIAQEHIEYVHNYNERLRALLERIEGTKKHGGAENSGDCGQSSDDDDDDKQEAIDDEEEAMSILGEDVNNPIAHRRLAIEREMLKRRVMRHRQEQHTTLIGGANNNPPLNTRTQTDCDDSNDSTLLRYGGVLLVANVGNSYVTRLAEVYATVPNPNGRLMSLKTPTSIGGRPQQYPIIISRGRIVEVAGEILKNNNKTTDAGVDGDDNLKSSDDEGDEQDDNDNAVCAAEDFVGVISLSNVNAADSAASGGGEAWGSAGFDEIDAAAATSASYRRADAAQQSHTMVFMPLVVGRRNCGKQFSSSAAQNTSAASPFAAAPILNRAFHAAHTTVLVGAVLGPTLSLFESSFWSTVAQLSKLFATFYEYEKEQRNRHRRTRSPAAANERWERSFYLQHSGSGGGSLSSGGIGLRILTAIVVLEALELRIGEQLSTTAASTSSSSVAGSKSSKNNNANDSSSCSAPATNSNNRTDGLVELFLASEALRKALMRFSETSLRLSNVPHYLSTDEATAMRAKGIVVGGGGSYETSFVDPSRMDAVTAAQNRQRKALEALREEFAFCSSSMAAGSDDTHRSAPSPEPLIHRCRTLKELREMSIGTTGGGSTVTAYVSVLSTPTALFNAMTLAPPLHHGIANTVAVAEHNHAVVKHSNAVQTSAMSTVAAGEENKGRANTARTSSAPSLTLYDEFSELPSSIYASDCHLSGWEVVSVPNVSMSSSSSSSSAAAMSAHRSNSGLCAAKEHVLQAFARLENPYDASDCEPSARPLSLFHEQQLLREKECVLVADQLYTHAARKPHSAGMVNLMGVSDGIIALLSEGSHVGIGRRKGAGQNVKENATGASGGRMESMLIPSVTSEEEDTDNDACIGTTHLPLLIPQRATVGIVPFGSIALAANSDAAVKRLGLGLVVKESIAMVKSIGSAVILSKQ